MPVGAPMPVSGRPPVPHPPPPPRQAGPWKSRQPYLKQPGKLQTFIGSNSNTSADSGFRDNSDREVSDVDSETNNPDHKAPQMLFYQRARNNNVDAMAGTHKYIPPPPRPPSLHQTAPMCHNGYHRNNCACPSQRTSHYGNVKNPENNQYFYGSGQESIVMRDLAPRLHEKDNSLVINLADAHSSDRVSSDVVV